MNRPDKTRADDAGPEGGKGWAGFHKTWRRRLRNSKALFSAWMPR
jgi:hypothetical protein